MPFQISFIGPENFLIRFEYRPIYQHQYVAKKILISSDSILTCLSRQDLQDLQDFFPDHLSIGTYFRFNTYTFFGSLGPVPISTRCPCFSKFRSLVLAVRSEVFQICAASFVVISLNLARCTISRACQSGNLRSFTGWENNVTRKVVPISSNWGGF